MNDKLVRNLEFKEWREFLVSVNNDLNNINEIMRECYLNKGRVLQFSNALNNFVTSKFAYIQNEKIIKDLDKIEEQLYKEQFVEDLKNMSSKAEKYLSSKFNELKNIYRLIVLDISNGELIPKQTKYDKDIPGAVRISGVM